MKNTFLKVVILCLTVSITSCGSDDGPVLLAPTVTSSTTASNVALSYTTVEINGSATSEVGNAITARGVCWSVNPNPTIADTKTTETSDTFTSAIANLEANTTYYFRVYATNSIDTSYSTQQTYTTLSIDDTTWDFTVIYDATKATGLWHADVTFNADGTTVYDEPDFPGLYLTNGTWSLSGNTLSYDMDSSDPENTVYQFTGILNPDHTMSGTYTFGTENRAWSAIKY